ncbi:nitrogen regulatory protein P-II family [Anaerovirgula multivorans]|uniref:Nitrogen regulatory protein P-II family n=1 Tax=Anaerovirgula multivorans TaxID=312168 RepID=A0A239C3V5_9FIRM|nr:P-II family nitrogen regulator [Anaerovirgula multivorans]SNS14311.1 nitrogen regulatory protein P-II family [Anaerovirgula multivorans]
MKEIIAVIRMNMVNQTKNALALEGFPAFTCTKVFGRGKKPVNDQVPEESFLMNSNIPAEVAESISEKHRLLPKRLLSITVPDKDVDRVVNTIIEINQTSNPGDGKIFVLSVGEAVRVRTGETGEQAII